MVTKDNSVVIGVRLRWVHVRSPATYTMAVQDMALLPDMARLVVVLVLVGEVR